MTGLRRFLSLLAGGMQCVFGAVSSVFAYLVYASPWTRETLSVVSGEIPLLMFLLLVFSAFSTLSGLLLIWEETTEVRNWDNLA